MWSDRGSGRAVCAIGDTHGHLQLGLCMAARWQQHLGLAFEAVFLCGDVGTFTSENQLDNATRWHAKANPCELEFLYQWAADPQPEWLSKIFEPAEEGGLGLLCPVVMVHGNHEGFAQLETLVPPKVPDEPVDPLTLPAVDPGRHIRYLPSGWRCRTPSGLVVAGVGGIERNQRYSKYPEMAYIDEDAVARLLGLGRHAVDVLITHQGPSGVQGKSGSAALQLLLEDEVAHVWFHGHSVPNPDIVQAGPRRSTLVVPLQDIAFSSKGPTGDDPGGEGWAVLYGRGAKVCRQRPEFWREYRKRKWRVVDEHRLVCPDLARFVRR